MSYEIIPLKEFLNQLKSINPKYRRIIETKINLIKENPYRYKRIHSKNYSRVFRVRFSIENKETRLIYIILEPSIILVCLLDRKRDYNDLEKHLEKLRKEI